jgi:hypothetical protein
MLVFGSINLPVMELLLILVLLFFIFLVLIIFQLHRLQRMTTEEKEELNELEKLAQEEKSDLDAIKAYENIESADIGKFEHEILELEEDTETLYLKKLAPDLYKIQNYVLWAMQKGHSPEQIKQELLSKGWKDTKLMDMVLHDILRYKGYYKDNKGQIEVTVPQIKEEKTAVVVKEQPQKVVKVVEKPVIIHHKTSIIRTKIEKPKAKQKRSAKSKKKEKKTISTKAKKADKEEFSDVEKELVKLEKDLKKENKKEGTVLPKEEKKGPKAEKKAKRTAIKKKALPKKSIPAKKDKLPAKKEAPPAPKKDNKDASVIVEAKKGTEVKVTYK